MLSTPRCIRNSPASTVPYACSMRSRLSHPALIPRIQSLRQELLDLTIVVASLREQLEADPTIEINPADIRQRLGSVATRFREHQAREADLVYEATGRELDKW